MAEGGAEEGFGWGDTPSDKADLWEEVISAFGEQVCEQDGLKAHLEEIIGRGEITLPKTTPNTPEEARPLLLNLEILEAKGIKGKDVNGLSDPFCSVFLGQGQKYYTSMKSQTLNPSWGDFFSIGVECAETLTLNIQVWHYHPETTLGDRMNQLRQGTKKGTPKLRKLLKEIAKVGIPGGSNCMGQTPSQEFLGCVQLPLKNIPREGVVDGWFFLGGRTPEEVGIRGQIHLRLALAQEKERAEVLQRYRQFLHLCSLQELTKSGGDPWWTGSFHPLSQFSMGALELLWALSSKDVALCRWLAYTRVQTTTTMRGGGGISPELWPPLFQKTEEAVKNHKYSSEDTQKFYFATRKLVESFIKYFQNMDKAQNEVGSGAILATMQLIVAHLRGGRDIKGSTSFVLSVESVMEGVSGALTTGATELFSQRVAEQKMRFKPASVSTRVEKLGQFGHILIADLIKGDKIMSPDFKRFLGINYFEIVYTVYDEKYANLLNGPVTEVCSSLKRLDAGVDHITLGNHLFTLYLVIKQFAELSWKCDSFFKEKGRKLCVAPSFHSLFISAVPLWLEISYVKALHRIERAVEADNFEAGEDHNSKTSVSAMATLKIVSQVALFWSQLAWPVGPGWMAFLDKIVNNLSRLLTHYADITLFKWDEIDEMTLNTAQTYGVSPSFCFAVNNCDLVGGVEVGGDLLEKLGIGNITKRFQGAKGQDLEKRLNSPLTKVGLDVEKRTGETLERVGIKIRSSIVQLLLEALDKASLPDLEPVVKYLNQNISQLKGRLCRKSHFNKMFAILRENSLAAVKEVIQLSIKEQRPPPYFEKILSCVQNHVDFFHPDLKGTSQMDPRISEMIQLIRFYTVTTETLILNYYQNREIEGLAVTTPRESLGTLTLRIYYSDDVQILRIEILNARYLKPPHPNGHCHPYVKLRLVPVQTFPGSPKFRSNTRKNTTFPLFDESFSIPLTLKEMKGPALIVFTLRSQSFGMGESDDFLGECFLPLASIPWVKTGNNLSQLALTSLNITRPTSPTSSVFATLENRQWDSYTVDFVKKEREKFKTSQS